MRGFRLHHDGARELGPLRSGLFRHRHGEEDRKEAEQQRDHVRIGHEPVVRVDAGRALALPAAGHAAATLRRIGAGAGACADRTAALAGMTTRAGCTTGLTGGAGGATAAGTATSAAFRTALKLSA